MRLKGLPFLKNVIEKNSPSITSSANLSGVDPPCEVSELSESLVAGAHLVVDEGRCRFARHPNIIDLTREGKLLRG